MVSEVRLYLVGFMGAGKTTVARRLADRTGWPRVELDEEIAKTAGCSIPQIFEQHGEDHFRELETRSLRRVADRQPPVIVSCGGGLPVREENREVLRCSGLPVYLHVEPETAWERVGNDPERPLAQNRDEFVELMHQRLSVYEKISTRVDTTEKAPPEVAREVLEVLETNDPDG